MWVGFIRVTRTARALAALGLLGVACTAAHRDCYESRRCPETAADDGGSNGEHDPGNASSAGQADLEPGTADGAGAAGWRETSANTTTPAGPPRVLSVTPSDGAIGVAQDTRIVIAFSRAMDTAATELAYESDDLPATSLRFSWDERGTTLTLSPRTPLEYAAGPDGATASPAFPALVYHYGFDARAADELGHSLASVHFRFSTLRRASLELLAESERTGNWTSGEGEGIHNCLRTPKAGYEPTVCIGDDINNVRYSGLLSFDLSALPHTISQFTSARLLASALVHGAPDQLGASQLEHVAYGELGEAALTSRPISPPSQLFVAANLIDRAQLALNLDVAGAVADDFVNRASRGERSQYRLAFAKVWANDHWDDVELPTSAIRLALGYLVP